jgi:hypothetical protein
LQIDYFLVHAKTGIDFGQHLTQSGNALSTGITKGCASADRSEVELQSASNGIPQR